MSTTHPIAHGTALQPRTANLILLGVFTGTIFLSALLLFSVQPMFAKMVLPLLGGSPSVWSVAMVFFQAVLLLGYGYAHAMTRFLDPRRAVIAHLCVFALALIALPLSIASGWGRPPSEYTALWLIGLFGVSIGLPFFAVAANAPMLQAWFARTNHPQAQDPYFLYGASNLGSFAALLAYPIVIEPFLTLREQSAFWSAGFVALMFAIAIAGLALTMNFRAEAKLSSQTIAASALHWRDRLQWMALAFVPSALLIAVTSHISTDIASAPFLWVIPLALFLGTFVLTFRHGGDRMHDVLVRVQPYVVAPLAIGLIGGERAFWMVAILLNLSMFAVSAMICHRELYLRRPAASHLTEFYLWISAGGVLGGIATGLVAPAVFSNVWEYPILIVLALLCRPGAFADGVKPWLRDGGLIAAAVLLILLPGLLFKAAVPEEAGQIWMIALVIAAGLIMLQASHPARLASLVAAVLIVTAFYQSGSRHAETTRSFFGVHKVVESADGRFRILYHGTTIHGAQRIRDDAGNVVTGRPEPLTYYYNRGPMSEAINATRAARGALNNVMIVGLGSGSLACQSRPGERWTYFEIDPAVIDIARDRSKFRMLSDCAPAALIVLGDARLTIAEATEPADLMVLDAFSSDVVPVHLLTREALDLYLSKLAPNGVLVFHISNRYLELSGVLTALAAERGLVTYLKRDQSATRDDFSRNMYANSIVAAVARSEADIAKLAATGEWKKQTADRSLRPWTDDFSNVLAAMWRMTSTK
jgi:SAM-dependent methyltransferase